MHVLDEADYVIVGSGSAGCALAYRLSESGAADVLVIEAGGTDAGPFIQMPGALSMPMNMRRYDWGYRAEPEAALGGRRLQTPRGRVIGGSSSINGMVYVRGHAKDFDHWAQTGAEGWAYADVLPYFKRMEAMEGGDPLWRGLLGPLNVKRGEMRNPLYAAFIEAGRQAGYPVTEDYNAAAQEGFGPMQHTIWRGRRWSAANAYLRPALRRANCRLRTAEATHVVLENGRARGVAVKRGHRRLGEIRARKEVILAAGAINSPLLLLRSGIGPAAELAAAGVEPRVPRAGVGKNLQDHLEVYVQQACTQPITLNGYLNLFAKGQIGMEWMLLHTGHGATNHFESCAFIRSAAGVDYPDIQYHFLPAAIRYDGQAAAEGHGFQVHVGPMRSKSRGEIRLTGAGAEAPPSIRFNYMSHAEDWRDFRQALRLTREIFAQGAFDPYRGPEIQPGAAVASDDELDRFVRDHAESAYHPCGANRMGAADDPLAVVDPQCRVIGVEALRVADSSIFPRVTNGNLNAPSIMTGEKAADHILGRALLAPERLQPVLEPDWESRQR
ncbi:oxygen-dependent choline dehydrogenase [Aureimonas endophytica]|uniref:Choline dehydrogenase n=1 Tax=Aureimonas endophytica TaxID=2027858 RepID=A0A917E768_9HYPH|nr:choline dehydrogenase [Aureimonas endophytica]GGE07351.1 oxygen-dependent choline dehydrogenase [Aureimonas endophytica]